MELNMDLGRAAFEAYKEYVKNRTHDGRPIPDWDDLGQSIQEAWAIAAMTAGLITAKAMHGDVVEWANALGEDLRGVEAALA